MKTAAIMQPTYLPWTGYFGMIDAVEIFVLYDDVQFVQRSWQRRNKIKTANGWTWLTVPIEEKFGQAINEVRISTAVDWKTKHWKSIVHSYQKAPFFKDYRNEFENFYQSPYEKLSDLNAGAIRLIAGLLGISTEIVLASSLGVSGSKTDRLLAVLEKIGADSYVSSPTSQCYMENEKFHQNNLRLIWYEYEHPIYSQLYGEFIPFLSVIDLLFNEGPRSLEIIRTGSNKALREELPSGNRIN